jgi:hypothetical protein
MYLGARAFRVSYRIGATSGIDYHNKQFLIFKIDAK